jgi:hypothetical protein
VPTTNGRELRDPNKRGWTQAEVKAMVDAFYGVCPVDGIYFDEGPADYAFPVDATVRGFYRAIYGHVKTKTGGAGTLVMLNAASTEDHQEWIMGPQGSQRAADIAQLVESPARTGPGGTGYTDPAFHLQPWGASYPPDRVMHGIHTCTHADMPNVVALSCQRGAGYVNVFDGGSGAYSRLPTPAQYWTDEQAAVAACGTPPETTITSGPSGTVSSTSASFVFASSKPNSTFECRLDSGAWQVCPSPKDYTALAPGSHTFEVRASDAAGNVDPSPALCTWTIELLDPCQQMEHLIGYVIALGLRHGLERSLNAKLRNAHRDCERGHDRPACNKVSAFQNEVSAQAGNGLTVAQANELLARSRRIRDALGC